MYERHDEMFDGVMSPSDSQEESQREAGGRREEDPASPAQCRRRQLTVATEP